MPTAPRAKEKALKLDTSKLKLEVSRPENDTRDPRGERRVRASGKPRPIPIGEKLLLTYEDLASTADLPIGTLRRLVQQGRGPRLVLVGRHHRFLPSDVEGWIDELRDLSGSAR